MTSTVVLDATGVLHTREGILYTARMTTEGPGGGIGTAALVLYATPLQWN